MIVIVRKASAPAKEPQLMPSKPPQEYATSTEVAGGAAALTQLVAEAKQAQDMAFMSSCVLSHVVKFLSNFRILQYS